MITLLTCLLLIGIPLLGLAMMNRNHRKEERDRGDMRVSALAADIADADDWVRRYNQREGVK